MVSQKTSWNIKRSDNENIIGMSRIRVPIAWSKDEKMTVSNRRTQSEERIVKIKTDLI